MADVSDLVKGSGRFRDDTKLASYLVAEVKVAAVPGTSFYRGGHGKTASGAHKLRFYFCNKEETLALALSRLGAFKGHNLK